MESWRAVWRRGIVPLLSAGALEALREALESDDPRLVQGVTTSPPPLQCVQDWPVEAACILGYCGAVECGGFSHDVNPDGSLVLPGRQGAATVAQTEEFFARLCFDCDQRIGEPAGCRHFLNWADETPRDEMRRELLAEVKLALHARDDEDTPCPRTP